MGEEITVTIDSDDAVEAADALYDVAMHADGHDPDRDEAIRRVGDRMLFKANDVNCHGEVELGGDRSRKCRNQATRRRPTDGRPVCGNHDEDPHED